MAQNTQNEDMKIEEVFERLAEINAQLENSETGLADALNFYAEGIKLVVAAKKNLEGVEKEMEVLDEV